MVIESIFKKLKTTFKEMDKDTKGFLRGVITEYRKYVKKISYPEAEEYFNMLVAAIMLSFHDAYENFDIKSSYRVKSRKSIFDKIFEYLSEEYKSNKNGKENKKSIYDYNEHDEYQGRLKDEIADIFAITLIACNRPPTFYSNDPVISELIDEKKRNHRLLEKIQTFKSKLVKDEFSGSKPEKNYQYICSKKEYYINCIMVLERLKTMVPPEATDLLANYNQKLEEIKKSVPEKFFYLCDNKIKEANELKLVETTENLQNLYTELSQIDESQFSIEEQRQLKKLITEEDTKKVDFLDLSDDFTSRIHDKLDLEMTLRQVCSIFDNSEALKRLGVTLDKDAIKRKRTKTGYVADFLYINTPFGKMEIQLQSQHENKEGNYGYSAHRKMGDNKDIKEYELPELDDEEGMKKFLTYVSFISPQKYFAQYDETEENRIIIQRFGQYQNYKSLVSQIPRDEESEEYNRIKKYFIKLYKLRKKYFPDDDKLEKIEAITDYDLEEYLDSKNLSRILSGELFNENNLKKQEDDGR